MNRVNNWIVLTLVFFALSMGLMMFTNKPVWSIIAAVLCLACVAMALIRYEDHRAGADIGYGIQS